MALDSNTSLAIAQLVIYIILLPLIIYALIKHGKHGLVAYVCLTTFAITRIVPAAMTLYYHQHDEPQSLAAAIIDSIGLGPLLLCAAGVIDELQTYLYASSTKAKAMRLLVQINLHALIAAGIALGAFGTARAISATTPADEASRYYVYQKTGAVLVLLAWATLVLMGALLAARIRARGPSPTLWLYVGVMAALAPLGVRAVYSVFVSFDHSASYSLVYGGFGIRFVFAFLMMLVAAVWILVGALMSRNIIARSGVVKTGYPFPPAVAGSRGEWGTA